MIGNTRGESMCTMIWIMTIDALDGVGSCVGRYDDTQSGYDIVIEWWTEIL